MRIAIMGTGGVGSVFGAKLAETGAAVTFIARGAHLAALRENGLTIELHTGESRQLAVSATDDPATIGPVDLILFTVKLYDTEPAARALIPIIAPQTTILTLQNGVESVAMLDRLTGAGHTLGGAAYVVANITAPGRIRQVGARARIVFGAPSPALTDRARKLAAYLAAANIDAEHVEDMNSALWCKFIFLAASAALTSLTRQPLGIIRDDPVMRATLHMAIDEAAAVGRARGVALPLDLEETIRHKFDHDISPAAKSSQLVDLERGRPLELEWISGTLHRFGQEAGVATPLHTTAYAALKPFAAGTPPPPEK